MNTPEQVAILTTKANDVGGCGDRIMWNIKGVLQKQIVAKAEELGKAGIDKQIAFLLDNGYTFEQVEAIITEVKDEKEGNEKEKHGHAKKAEKEEETQTHGHGAHGTHARK